jgi:hypothetical protein
LRLRYEKFSIFSVFALPVGSTCFALAGAHQESTPHLAAGSTFKYVELNEIGDAAKVLEVKEGVSDAVNKGEVRISVLAASIHPSNFLTIAGRGGLIDLYNPVKG